MLSTRAHRLFTVLGLAISAACGDASKPPAAPTAPAPVVPKPAPTMLVAVSTTEMAGTSIAPLTVVPETPAVRVLDQNGQPMAGVHVSFSAYSGSVRGGSLADTLVTSDTDGRASCGQWVVGAAEGSNWVFAAVPGVPTVTFHVLVLAPAPAGVRYDLQTRDGSPLRSGEAGYLVLASDGTFRLEWLWGLGTSGVYTAVNTGTFTRGSAGLTFISSGLGAWAAAVEQSNMLTFSYDDFLDIGFHSIVVEVYARRP